MLENAEQVLMEKMREDEIYQTLLRICAEAEEAYSEVVGTLPPQTRDVIERYLSACDELEHRRTILALSLFKKGTSR